MVDTDRLAEIHYADYDPQFEDDEMSKEDLEREVLEMLSDLLENSIYQSICFGEEGGLDTSEFIEKNKDTILELVDTYLDDHRR